MTLSLASIIVAVPDQLSSEVAGEAVILHMDRGVYFGLDPIGTRVWGLIRSPCRVSDVCAALELEYEVDAGRCQGAVLALLREMLDADLIRIADASAE
jgi:hypothetical protein